MSNTVNSFRFICSGIKPLYTSSFRNLSKAPFKRTQQILVANNSQHCWMLHVASVCTPCYMLLRVVGRWCAKFETGQTFSYVQTDTSTLNTVRPTKLGVVASVCKWLKVTDTHDKFPNCLFPLRISTTQKKWERTSPKFGEIRSYNWHLVQVPLCWRDMQGPVKWLPMSVSSRIYWEKLRCKHWWVPVISLQKRYHNSLYMNLNLVNSSVIDNLMHGLLWLSPRKSL